MIRLFNTFLQHKIMLSVFMLFFFCSFTQAQVTGPTAVDTHSTHRYYYDDGISYAFNNWVVSGPYTSAVKGNTGTNYYVDVAWAGVGTGSVTFRKKTIVLSTLANIVISVPAPTSGPSPGQNYVHTTTPKIATTNVSSLSDADKIESIAYFDGLGRAMQSVGIRAGGNGEDIITHVGYDEYGRQAKDYLPYTASSTDGSFRTDGLSATNTYYDATKYEADFPSVTVNNINAYSEKEFEASPLNRVLKQAAPGKDWKLGNGHEIEFNYQTNTATEVRRYEVSLNKTVVNSVTTYIPTLVLDTSSGNNNGYYNANTLYKTITKDENHDGTSNKNHITEEFKDKQGRVVLKRIYADMDLNDDGDTNDTGETEVSHDTYYVYDKFGNLSYVLPPKAEAHIDIPTDHEFLTNTELYQLCYKYTYDDRNRLVEKKLPGKMKESFVYNNLDQIIMTQDYNTSKSKNWLFTKYDAFGRVAYTGLIEEDPTNQVGYFREYHQHLANLATTNYVSKLSSNPITIGGTTIYYSDETYPTNLVSYNKPVNILTINYYDDYNFDIGSGTSETAYGVTPTTNTKGLATGSKVRVLNSSPVKWITSVSYYDDKSRPIYVYSFNDYLNTTDKVKSKLDFTGVVDETTTTHAKTGQSTITTIDYFTYDDAGRLVDQSQKIDDKISRRLVKNKYDELGQLESKFIDNGTQDGYKDLVGVSLINDELSKSAANGWDGGFATNGSFSADGYIEYTIPQTNKSVMAGLSTDNSSASFNTIDYAIFHASANIFIYESGSSKGLKATCQAGDVLKVERIGTTINYLKNGEIFYTSLTASSGSLIGDGCIYHTAGKIKDLKIVDNENGLQNVDYTYNIRGWLKQINNPTAIGNDLFGFKIGYNEGAAALYNGNISSTQWKTNNTDASVKTYNYTYDALNRITSATDDLNRYSLSNMSYDKNGNIKTLKRKGHVVANPVSTNSSDFGIMDDLIYTYQANSNLLIKVEDVAAIDGFGFKDDAVNQAADGQKDYYYTPNGDLTYDANKGLTISTYDYTSYNHLGLPATILNSNSENISYIYDANGVKLKKIVSTGATTEYAGNYVYEGSSLKFFNHPEGYVDVNGSSYSYVYQYKDHLGNVRLSYKNDSSVTPVNVDDDFNSGTDGWSHTGSGSVSSSNQKLNISTINKYHKASKYLTITPNVPIHIEFDFEKGSMNLPYFFVQERINGVWESNSNRDAIANMSDGHYTLDLTLTGDYIRIYFEKGNSSDDGTLTTCYVDNFKLTQNGLEILEENNYYPFGLKHKGYNNNPVTNHKYELYNGVEYEESLGLNLYEMDVRSYDPAIGRFTGIDPVVHHSMSTYTAFDNNPIVFADPSGADAESWILDLFKNSESGTTYTNNDDGTFSGSDGTTVDCDECKKLIEERKEIQERLSNLNLNLRRLTRIQGIISQLGLQENLNGAVLGVLNELSKQNEDILEKYLKDPSKLEGVINAVVADIIIVYEKNGEWTYNMDWKRPSGDDLSTLGDVTGTALNLSSSYFRTAVAAANKASKFNIYRKKQQIKQLENQLKTIDKSLERLNPTPKGGGFGGGFGGGGFGGGGAGGGGANGEW